MSVARMTRVPSRLLTSTGINSPMLATFIMEGMRDASYFNIFIVADSGFWMNISSGNRECYLRSMIF